TGRAEVLYFSGRVSACGGHLTSTSNKHSARAVLRGGTQINRRNFIRLSTIAALGLAILPSSAPAQQKTLKEQLVGTWLLVSAETTNADGSKLMPFGPNPKGVLVMDANG